MCQDNNMLGWGGSILVIIATIPPITCPLACHIFKALYGYEALSFMDLAFDEIKVPWAKETMQSYQDILKALKDNIQHAQNQQKMYADRHWVE